MKNYEREIKILHCKRCGWKWVPRKKQVVLCPKCKSGYWDRERRQKKNLFQELNLDVNI